MSHGISFLDSEKYWFDVAFEEVLGHVFCDDSFVGFERSQVTVAQFGSDLETYVEELAEALIVGGIRLIVTQR